jgi:protein-tyrosine phosphatase
MADGATLPTHEGLQKELRIDWFDAPELGGDLPGRLGLTFLPGKRGASIRYPGHVYDRDTVEDLAALSAAGVRRLVLLVDDEELARWGDARIIELGRALGIDVRRYPMRDGTPPASHQVMDEILADVDSGRAIGDVAVACMGGVGRSGTVAACALVRAGRSARDAIERVRAVRHPAAVETEAQQDFVRSWAEHASQ